MSVLVTNKFKMKYIESALYIIFVAVIVLDLVLAVTHYRVLYLEDADLCSEITKRKIKLDHGPKSGFIVKQMRLNYHMLPWKSAFNCRFKVESSKGHDGLVVVIQYISLRKNETTGDCIDYVQFRAHDGRTSQKFCGRFNAELIMDSIFGVASKLEAVNNTFIDPDGELTTFVFVAKDALHEDEDLDLNIVYTTYKPCKYSPQTYKACLDNVKDICLYREYFYDEVINCPYIDCVDEGGCSPKEAKDVGPSIGNKVLIASVSTLLSIFIIFIWCLCICRKYEKFCWSPQFANSPNMTPPQSEAARVIEMSESPNRSQSNLPTTEPMSNESQEDKDLPPPYESLFPSR